MSTRAKTRGQNAKNRGKAVTSNRTSLTPASVSQKLDRIEKQLRGLQADQHHLAEFEQQTEAIVERKVYEIKALSYVTLIVASVLLALVLGMVLSALGIRFL